MVVRSSKYNWILQRSGTFINALNVRMMDERVKLVIKLIMDRENMTIATFANSIGVSTSAISHVLTGRNQPSIVVVSSIHKKYSYINLEWLIHGTGEMVNENLAILEAPSNTTASSVPSSGYSGLIFPSLFDQNPENAGEGTGISKNRKEMALETPISDVKQVDNKDIKCSNKPQRKIVEIRIFFDDNTYEIFKS